MKNPFSLDNYWKEAKSTGAEIIEIGRSVEGRPILALRKGRGDLRILAVARLHGNEPAPTSGVIEYFKENPPPGVEVYGIFLANPDGAALYEKLWEKNPEPHWRNKFERARFNANGKDLNRDWEELSQPETRALRDFLFQIKPQFVLDLHEFFWKEGFPPRLPTEEKEGFLATFTDAPYKAASEKVKKISEEAMLYLSSHLQEETGWKVKLRHFLGKAKNASPSSFFGVYLAIHGFAKLLVETWGVACSTLLLRERIAFHKRAVELAGQWIKNLRFPFDFF